MNRFIKTGSLFVLCTAASVSFATPNENAIHTNSDFSDAINGYMNWEQPENTSTGVMESHNNPTFSSRSDLSPTSDNFFEAINQYMNPEESEFAAAEIVSESRNNQAVSNKTGLQQESDNFSDAMLNYLDDLKK